MPSTGSAAAVRRSLERLDAMLDGLEEDQCQNNQYQQRAVEPPRRPPQPKDYTPLPNTLPRSTHSSNPDYASVRLPRVTLPPKLQHILDEERRHNLVKFEPRDDGVMRAPDFPNNNNSDNDYYDYSYGGSSTYLKPPEVEVPELSDEELEAVDAGEPPRGDKSMVIDTEHGKLKSKYTYMGFGLWEDTDPNKAAPPPRPRPPPPPPRAPSPPTPEEEEVDETVWYNCTVTTESHKSSKELDDLVHNRDGFERLSRRHFELGDACSVVPARIGRDLWEPFEKEDMSDMFRRALMEKMALTEAEARTKVKCCVCRKWIEGRIITAMEGKKFHPQCFVCQYCRQPFKDRTFKSDSAGRPYCCQCFEKLLGHFGSAHFDIKELQQ